MSDSEGRSLLRNVTAALGGETIQAGLSVVTFFQELGAPRRSDDGRVHLGNPVRPGSQELVGTKRLSLSLARDRVGPGAADSSHWSGRRCTQWTSGATDLLRRSPAQDHADSDGAQYLVLLES